MLVGDGGRRPDNHLWHTPQPRWQNLTDTGTASQTKKKKKRHSLFVGIGQSEFCLFVCLKTSLLSF